MKMIGKNGQKKKKLGDEDETPIRVKVREFVEGKFVTATEMAPTRRGRLMVAGADTNIRRAVMDFTIP
jgi:hypothetical protein